MLKAYEGQVCLITGASSGIGAAFARELDRRGARLVLFARRAEKLAEVAGGLAHDPLVIAGDITLAADRTRLVDETLAKFGRVDVLINNAGRGEGGQSFASVDSDTIEQVLQINLVSLIHLTHIVVPYMIQQRGGLIINVSSPMGHLGVPAHSLYNSSKAGVSMFSQTLGRELANYGIHVMDLLPGFTYSEMVTPESAKRLPRISPVKSADEVVIAALNAALKRKADLMTGGFAARLAMWFNRWLPRLVDWGVRRFGKR